MLDLPKVLLEDNISEGSIFYFEKDCPIGIKEHMHVCIKKGDRILLFSTCTSQKDTVYRFITRRNFDPNTYPMFVPDNANEFDKDTFVNCNNVYEIGNKEFAKLIEDGMVRRIAGCIDGTGLQAIAKGVKLSKTIERNIKALF